MMLRQGRLPPYSEIGFGEIEGAEGYRCPNAPEGDQQVLSGLERINIFVGKNNSGKSRFLRALFKTEDLEFNSPALNATRFTDAAVPVRAALQTGLASGQHTGLTGYAGIKATYLDDVIPGRCLPGAKTGPMLAQLRVKLTQLSRDLRDVPISVEYVGQPYDPMTMAYRVHEQVRPEAIKALQRLDGLTVTVGDEPRYYIPVLRGLRPLTAGFDDLYRSRTDSDYEISEGGGRLVFTGLGLYQQIEALKLGAPDQQQSIEEYERFLGLEFFDGERVRLTPRRGLDVVHIRVGSGPDRPIHALGDGVQAMVVLTFAAFTAEKESLFFIEEPEQHLHPGYQRRVMDLYARSEIMSRHQYFLTTHSNHLLDMATETSKWSAYVFRRLGEDVTEVIPFAGSHKVVLGELGARATSVFLTNASVWVEGVTDRLYLRMFLRRYLDERGRADDLREDTHYSLIEYGGANVTHWEFRDTEEFSDGINVARVCSRSIVLADGDIAGKGNRVARLTEALGEDFIVLRCKEIENLLPQEVVRAAVSQWVENSHDVERIRSDEYGGPETGLGAYLDSVLRMKRFGEPSGTIKSKVAFCRRCVQVMEETEWMLTPQATDLCERIVAFIDSANR